MQYQKESKFIQNFYLYQNFCLENSFSIELRLRHFLIHKNLSKFKIQIIKWKKNHKNS